MCMRPVTVPRAYIVLYYLGAGGDENNGVYDGERARVKSREEGGGASIPRHQGEQPAAREGFAFALLFFKRKHKRLLNSK